MSLSIRMCQRFPTACIDVAFETPTPGVTVLFGPSGAGKSTVVAAAAGLLRPETCVIEVDGHRLSDTQTGLCLPPEKRQVGMVFQDARLFPHMTVASNLRFGLRRAAPGPIGMDEVVELLGVGHLLRRRPATLSGGERQRVAIGRALLAQPRLLLMDEPLASLDADRKAEILPYLARLKTVLGLPILYVTHSVDEAAHLADSIVLMQAGRVLSYGPLAEMATQTAFPLGRRDDIASVLQGYVAAHDEPCGLSTILVGGDQILVPQLDVPVGAGCRVRVRAREVILATARPTGISVHNVLAGTVRHVASEQPGRSALVELAMNGYALVARVTADAVDRLGLIPGRPVMALVKSTSIEVLSAGGATGLPEEEAGRPSSDMRRTGWRPRAFGRGASRTV